jgi:hypothetical protein
MYYYKRELINSAKGLTDITKVPDPLNGQEVPEVQKVYLFHGVGIVSHLSIAEILIGSFSM